MPLEVSEGYIHLRKWAMEREEAERVRLAHEAIAAENMKLIKEQSGM